MDPAVIEWKSVAIAACAFLNALLLYQFRNTQARMDHLDQRLGDLAGTTIKREEMQREIDRVHADINTRHAEHKAAWERIEMKIDKHESVQAERRHRLDNAVQVLVTRVAVIAAKLGAEGDSGPPIDRS